MELSKRFVGLLVALFALSIGGCAGMWGAAGDINAAAYVHLAFIASASNHFVGANRKWAGDARSWGGPSA